MTKRKKSKKRSKKSGKKTLKLVAIGIAGAVGAYFAYKVLARPCEEGATKTETCPDGSTIHTYICLDGKWVKTGEICSNILDGCLSGKPYNNFNYMKLKQWGDGTWRADFFNHATGTGGYTGNFNKATMLSQLNGFYNSGILNEVQWQCDQIQLGV
jgi:hypothetical protein